MTTRTVSGSILSAAPAIALALLAPTSPALAGGPFASQGVQLRSWIPLAQFGAQQTIGNDCWGYVSPTGREYAIMGLSHTTAFVEITDPINPVIVAQITHPTSVWSDTKVFSTFAYVVTEGGGGVQVIDLSQIDAGVVTLVGSFTPGGLDKAHDIGINEQSGFAYACRPTGLLIFDLSNPTSPALAGSWPGHDIHDVQAVTYTTGPFAGREIAFCSTGSEGLFILDTTDKANIVTLSNFVYPNLGFTHQGWLSGDGLLFYLDDEFDELNGFVATTTTRVVDVSDLSAPTLASTFTSGEQSIDHNQYIKDGVIYQANYTSGLRIFDARPPNDPLNPPQIGFFDTRPEVATPSPFVFDGAWSVFPFFPSGNVIVSDINRGLFVLDPSQALFVPSPADLNGDGFVNASDLAALLSQWGTAGSADLDASGTVDAADLAALLASWG